MRLENPLCLTVTVPQFFPSNSSDAGTRVYTRVPASLEFDGKNWGTVTVRHKGFSSRIYAPSALKRPLKLAFDTPDKSRTFFGMRSEERRVGKVCMTWW